jgi:transcriptional regulator with XRE-family HTH domain
MPKSKLPDLTVQVAAAISELREVKGFSLDGLERKSGVSRSMISLIERAQTSPTAVVLDKLARALGVTLASLFGRATLGNSTPPSPVSRRRERAYWRDPDSGYVRANVSPTGRPQPMQIVEVEFPARARVTFENGARGVRIYQQIWVLAGAINISLGEDHHALREGDCLAMELDRPTILHNPTRKVTRYALVIATETLSRR